MRKEDLSRVVVLTVDGYFVGKFSLRFKVTIEFCMTNMDCCVLEVYLSLSNIKFRGIFR